LFYGPVRVPAETKLGKAKVTLSFPGWKVSPLAPVVTEVSVLEQEIDKTSK
jgi:hypothetical protein